MKAFFILAFLTLIISCSTTKNAAGNDVTTTEKSIIQDSVQVIKPLILNGKVVTPSQNNSEIIPQ